MTLAKPESSNDAGEQLARKHAGLIPMRFDAIPIWVVFAAERDHLFAELKKTGDLAHFQIIDGFHKLKSGKNGGGDPWYTDGRLELGVIKTAAAK